LAVGECTDAQLVASKKSDTWQQNFNQKFVLREMGVIKKRNAAA
jgi:hypothetical protein